MPQHVLQIEDDPENLCKKMSNEWVVSDKLPIGRKVDGHKYVRCSPLIIGNGDFVDVAVELDIATSRNASGGNMNHVHLSMQHVIQLVTAQDVATVCSFAVFWCHLFTIVISFHSINKLLVVTASLWLPWAR